jgi:phenylalanyl-tRNA synthetase alpha chain
MNGSTSTTLHPIERMIIKVLSTRADTPMTLEELAKEASLSIDQVRRGVEWLKGKQLVDLKTTEAATFSLGDQGKIAVTSGGLPERRLVNFVQNSGGKTKISQTSKELGNEFAPALGRAKRNNWIEVENDSISTTASQPKINEELVLEKLKQARSIPQGEFSKNELQAIEELQKWHRGYVEKNGVKLVTVALTQLGMDIVVSSTVEEIDAITPKVLQSAEWKEKPIRAIDVSSPVPKLFGGKRHPMRIFMDEVREAFVSLGFQEIEGTMSQSALWNFDALFIPQEHSAREMQDTFYVSGIKAGLEEFRAQIKEIKSVHETGSNTGSIGWRYKWKEEEASRVVLRTHTTAVTISYLAKHKPEEARVFTVGRVFRNEKTNYKHNPEFFQIEGVMVGERLNLRNLVYILSKFYSKLGFNEIKFWPTYFPYTEPSLQTMAFLKDTERWMELGGLGIFRPEVTLPLGMKNPVLAWGLSLDRLVMLRYGVNDIRSLFGANLEWLRSVPTTKV